MSEPAKAAPCSSPPSSSFLRIEGVELNPILASIAQANISLWHNDLQAAALSPFALHHADATTHPLPPEPTLAFLFHPFELPILRRFLRHVESSQAAHSKPFDLLYANAEHGSLLDRHPAFTRLWMGPVAMTPADHLADLAAIAEQKEYGSTGDELCAIYRYTGTKIKIIPHPWNYPAFQHVYRGRYYPYDFLNKIGVSFG